MQNFNPHYQPAPSMYPGSGKPFHAETPPRNYTYTLGGLDPSLFVETDQMAHNLYNAGNKCEPSTSTSSTASSASSGLSPTAFSMRSSISTSIPTPSTPYGMVSPMILKEKTNQGSWFGAMQESYLANQPQLDLNGSRPPLQRMQRMSISSPGVASTDTRQSVRGGNTLMALDSQQPRRASVVTFQPTTARPSSVPRRPSFQNQLSDPQLGLPHQQTSPIARQRSPLVHDISRLSQPSALPTIMQQDSPLPAENNAVDRLFAEVFGGHTDIPTTFITDSNMQPSSSQQNYHQPTLGPMYSPSPIMHSQSRQDNYNFAGVLLEPEDFHMLGPDPLTSEIRSIPQSAQYQSGWQTSFSLGTSAHSATSPIPRIQAPITSGSGANWSFSSFHGCEAPVVSQGPHQDIISRPMSAPPQSADTLDDKPIVFPEPMERRRGSSVDSPALFPFSSGATSTYQPSKSYAQPVSSPTRYSSAYLGPGPPHIARSTLAVRRSTVGPHPLNLVTGSYQPYPSHMSATLPLRKNSITSPTSSPSKRHAARNGSTSSRRGSSTAPMFINFTSKDANKLLTGVAPSGSSKRKREEEELARLAKQSKSHEPLNDSSVSQTGDAQLIL